MRGEPDEGTREGDRADGAEDRRMSDGVRDVSDVEDRCVRVAVRPTAAAPPTHESRGTRAPGDRDGPGVFLDMVLGGTEQFVHARSGSWSRTPTGRPRCAAGEVVLLGDDARRRAPAGRSPQRPRASGSQHPDVCDQALQDPVLGNHRLHQEPGALVGRGRRVEGRLLAAACASSSPAEVHQSVPRNLDVGHRHRQPHGGGEEVVQSEVRVPASSAWCPTTAATASASLSLDARTTSVATRPAYRTCHGSGRGAERVHDCSPCSSRPVAGCLLIYYTVVRGNTRAGPSRYDTVAAPLSRTTRTRARTAAAVHCPDLGGRVGDPAGAAPQHGAQASRRPGRPRAGHQVAGTDPRPRTARLGVQAAADVAEPDHRVRDYAGLAGALAAHIARTSPDPGADALLAGETGAALCPGLEAGGQAHNRRQVVDLLARLGFDPSTDARTTRIRLRRCPLLDVARASRTCVFAPAPRPRSRSPGRAGRGPGSHSPPTLRRPGSCLLHLDQPIARDPA